MFIEHIRLNILDCPDMQQPAWDTRRAKGFGPKFFNHVQ